MERLHNHIGGRFVPPSGGEWIDNVNPATGQVISQIARSGEADVESAVAAGQQALAGSWGRSSAARGMSTAGAMLSR